MIERVRKVLEKHKILIETPKYGTNQPWEPQKCTGCPWIGWDHVDHLAAAIAKAIK